MTTDSALTGKGNHKMTTYSKRLMEAMTEKGYTVRQLSMITGIQTVTIYNALKNGTEPNATTLCSLADALGVTMDWLWGRA
jgi:transcriptional regulator with XRE-family HTH domain